MSSAPAAEAPGRPVRIVVPVWAWPLALYSLLLLYLVFQDNGLFFASAADTVHEFFHDARHALGVPCH